MASTSLSWDTIGPFLIWQFLIPFAASWIQAILYSIFIRAGDPKPLPNTPRFTRHRRQILITVYLLYFLFTIYEIDYLLQKSSTLYSDLGVPPTVTESTLSQHFRRLTIRFHPDKIGPGVDRDRANDYYVSLKHARDVILDPAKRYAYDRFGPDFLRSCRQCITTKDYVDHALLQGAGTYGALLVILIGANALGYLKDGAYWRYLALLSVAVYDMRTAMRPDHPSFLTQYINPLVTSLHLRPLYLPFQLTTIIKKASISAAQFLGLLIPLYRDTHNPQHAAKTGEDTDEARHKQVDRLEGVMKSVALDTARLLELESVPFRENEKAKSELREALKKYMVQNVVHQEREVRDAMGRSMVRRRTGVPKGAVGNR